MLTTNNGKLSALTCTVSEDGTIELLAIERDHSVTRLLKAKAHRDQLEIRPDVVVDLWPMIRKEFAEKLNLEGIVRLRDGRIALANDDQGSGLGGSTWLFIFPLHRHRLDDVR